MLISRARSGGRHVGFGWRGVVVGLAAVLVGSGAALAQGGGGGGRGGDGGRGFMGGMGGGDAFSPSVDSREMGRYGDILGLTADQRNLVRELFDGYQQEFRARAQEARDKLDAMREQMREERNPEAFGEIRRLTEDFRKARTQMEQTFFSDVQLVLTPEQAALWPKVERTRRREQSMAGRGAGGFGQVSLSGERVDLIRLIAEEKLAPEVLAAVDPTLQTYEEELDKALIERNRLTEESATQIGELMAGGGMEQAGDKLQAIVQRVRDAAIRVRDLNRRYARQIEDLLPEAERGRFAAAVQQASFPQIYRTSNSSRQISAALGFSDLTEEQKTGIAALNESYTRDIAALNDKMAQAQEQSELSFDVRQMMRGRRGGPGGGQDQADRPRDPLQEMRQQRRDLDRATQESLRQILTPAQADRLPEPEQNQDGPGGRFQREGDAPPQRRGPRA